jgi:protein-S-isoprenylcysteine O-methyltransferase Ste14
MKYSNNNKHINIGRIFFKIRDYTPLPLILAMFICANPSILSASIGIFLIFIGELIRIHSVSYIGTISRTRSSSLGSKLIQEGPFSLIRNPLYAANFLITLGFVIFSNIQWIIVVATLGFIIQYHFIVIFEEAILQDKFGDTYTKYQTTVPRWLPRNFKNNQLINPFKIAIKSENRTITAILSILITLLIIH